MRSMNEITSFLEEVPSQLEPFIHGITSRIFRRSEEAARTLETKLLGPATFSRRTLTFEEGLNIFPSNIDWPLENFCSPLLAVDKLGRVKFRHPVIRDYLARQSEAEAPIINKKRANKHLFLACIQSLTTHHQRKGNPYGKAIEFNESSGFWNYAAEHWSFHLLSSGCDVEILSALEYFLQGKDATNWLGRLSADKQVWKIIRATDNLARYVATITKSRSDSGSPWLTPEQQGNFHSWVTQLRQFSVDQAAKPHTILKRRRELEMSLPFVNSVRDEPGLVRSTNEQSGIVATSSNGKSLAAESRFTSLVRESPTHKSPVVSENQSSSKSSNEGQVQSTISFGANQGVFAEAQMSHLLASSTELSAIFEQASKTIPRSCLERKICQALKVLYLGLRDHAGTDLERLSARILRTRNRRTRIAIRALDEAALKIEHNERSEENPFAQSFSTGQIELQNRPSDVQSLGKSQKDDNRSIGNHASEHIPSAATWDFDSSSEDISSDSEPFDAKDELPNILPAESFVLGGTSFQCFLVDLALHCLPPTLRNVVQMAPPEDITFLRDFTQSTTDRAKTLFQVHTGSEWDWWPLSPARPPLLPDRVRMRWNCV